jgi:hypothetical protein
MIKPIWSYASGLTQATKAECAEFLRRGEKRLRPYRADVPKRLRRFCLDHCFPGECFPRATQAVRRMREFPTVEYILGEAALGGIGAIPLHGWVEYEGLVFEPVLQEWYKKQDYYGSEWACPWYRFDRSTTLYLERRMRRHPSEFGYWWDSWLNLKPFGNGVIVSLEEVKKRLFLK